MQHQLKIRLATLMTVLTVVFSLGMGENSATAATGTTARAAAAERSESVAEKLSGLVDAARSISGCDRESLLDRAACYKAFARKAVKAGAGLALFAYAAHEGHKDSVQHFSNAKKEATKLSKLKEELEWDPTKITDPKEWDKAVAQVRATLDGAKKDIDNAEKHVIETLRVIIVIEDVTITAVQLMLKILDIVGDPKFTQALQETAHAMKEISTTLDEINDGMAEMNAALDEANSGVAEANKAVSQMNRDFSKTNGGISKANRGLSQMNRGISKANKGMGQLNSGITQANKGMGQLNRHVPGISKGADKLHELPGLDFDFSGLKNLWNTEATGLDLADQDRRMGLLLDLLPGAGDGKSVIEAVTGKDLATGQRLTGTERALGVLSVMRWLKAGGKLTADEVRDARKGYNTAPCTPNSFTPSTPVLMADGSHKPIAQVTQGEQVLAADPSTGRTTPQPVTEHIIGRGTKNLVQLTVDTDGDAGNATADITSTDQHPFWTFGPERWTSAADIIPGIWLRTATGSRVQITAVRARTVPDQTVHNLTVAGLHTYYVLAGQMPVLVHNSTGCGAKLTRGEKVAAAAGADELSPALRKSLTGFMKKSPGDAEIPQIIRLPEGGAEFSYKVPGRVPGSFAVYRKRVDAAGSTESAYKTTFLPDGKIAHIKFK